MEQANEQNFKNHARLHPPFHFVLSPILLMHLVYSGYLAVTNPGWPSLEGFLLAVGLFLTAWFVRTYALKVQDRVIRLEERLRYREVLPADLLAESAKLTVGQMVALRFASDAELPGLMRKVLQGELVKSKDIKMAIQQWRGDFYRV
ncbi:MAG: DUF6526 family protein [Bryobacter sp.]|nr:DUF6526 family protein [Bryobacter sp.]